MLTDFCKFQVDTEELLWLAAAKGWTNKVKNLLQRDIQINAKNEDGETALFLAVYHGHVTTVKELLKHKPDVDVKKSGGWTALHAAVTHHNIKMTKTLDQTVIQCCDLNRMRNNK